MHSSLSMSSCVPGVNWLFKITDTSLDPTGLLQYAACTANTCGKGAEPRYLHAPAFGTPLASGTRKATGELAQASSVGALN